MYHRHIWQKSSEIQCSTCNNYTICVCKVCNLCTCIDCDVKLGEIQLSEQVCADTEYVNIPEDEYTEYEYTCKGNPIITDTEKSRICVSCLKCTSGDKNCGFFNLVYGGYCCGCSNTISCCSVCRRCATCCTNNKRPKVKFISDKFTNITKVGDSVAIIIDIPTKEYSEQLLNQNIELGSGKHKILNIDNIDILVGNFVGTVTDVRENGWVSVKWPDTDTDADADTVHQYFMSEYRQDLIILNKLDTLNAFKFSYSIGTKIIVNKSQVNQNLYGSIIEIKNMKFTVQWVNRAKESFDITDDYTKWIRLYCDNMPDILIYDRVIRGPNWTCGNEDSGNYGTVIRIKGNLFVVHWDHGLIKKYEKSELQVTHKYIYSIGTIVARNKNWIWGDQDQKQNGEIVSYINGWVEVKWNLRIDSDKSTATSAEHIPESHSTSIVNIDTPCITNKYTHTGTYYYRMGAENMYDLIVIEFAELYPYGTRVTLDPPSTKHPTKLGSIIEKYENDIYDVKWDNIPGLVKYRMDGEIFELNLFIENSIIDLNMYPVGSYIVHPKLFEIACNYDAPGKIVKSVNYLKHVHIKMCTADIYIYDLDALAGAVTLGDTAYYVGAQVTQGKDWVISTRSLGIEKSILDKCITGEVLDQFGNIIIVKWNGANIKLINTYSISFRDIDIFLGIGDIERAKVISLLRRLKLYKFKDILIHNGFDSIQHLCYAKLSDFELIMDTYYANILFNGLRD
jgi:hypothetical protein